MRECWNGRQARLRCVWLRRVGSSPISRIKKLGYPLGVSQLFDTVGTRTIKCKCPVDICSAAAGRRRHHSVTSPISRMEKGLPLWGGPFSMREMGLERAAAAQAAVKTVRWTVFSPWESPFQFETHPVGVWSKLEPFRYQKTLVHRTFSKKSHKNTRTKILVTPCGVADIFMREPDSKGRQRKLP